MFKKILFALALVAGLAMSFAEPHVYDTAELLAEPGAAAYGGNVTIAALSGVRTWNVAVSAEVDDIRDLTMGDGWSSLVRRDKITQEFVPFAAESMDVSADGLTLTFTLRPDLQWSDGEPITASDYLFSYTVTQDPAVESANTDNFFIGDSVVEVTAPDEMTVVFEFPQPDRTALSIVSYLEPMPDHILGEIYRNEGAEAFRGAWGTDTPIDELVFDGPFMVESYSPDERAVLVRNPGWANWNVDSQGNALPYLDSVTVTIAQQEAQTNLFLAGELDLYSPANLDEVSVVAQAVNSGELDAELRPNLYPTESRLFYSFNFNLASDPFKQALFRSVQFRQAMSYLTPREAIVDLVYGGAAEPMYLPVSEAFSFWIPPEDRQQEFPFDPERALELLAEIGFTQTNDDGWLVDAEGNELGFTIATNAGNANREQTMQLIADAMRENGINVETTALDFSLLVDQLLSTGDDRPFESILIGLSGGSLDWFFSQRVYGCAGGLHMFNTSGSCLSPSETLIDNLVKQGARTLDNAEAQEYGYQIVEEWTRNQFFIQTVAPLAHASWSSDVAGEYAEADAIFGTRSLVFTYKR